MQKRFSEFQLGVDSADERFTQVDNMATALVEAKNPQSPVIVQTQEEDLLSKWDDLLNAVDSRNDRLQAAEEIHTLVLNIALLYSPILFM